MGTTKVATALEHNQFKNVSNWVIFCDKHKFKRIKSINMALMIQEG